MEHEPGSSKTFGMKGKVIHSQAREIIANVLDFMRREAENGSPTIPLSSFKERLLAATKISEATYKRIVKEKKLVESNEKPSFSTPKKAKRTPTKSVVRSGELETIRKMIHDFFIIEKRRPTLKTIFKKINECGLSFDGGISTLRTVMQNMGFKWKKSSDKRQLLMESHDVQYKRIVYLKKLTEYKKEGRPIIYIDETYIHSSHTTPHEWSDGSNLGLKKPIGKGKRLIIVHAGGAFGFVPNALLIFTSGAKSGDYHNDMNADNFLRWVETQLIPNIPPRSVLVIDNASYHNVTAEKEPTSTTLKKDMISWLTDRNIPYSSSMVKPELYEIIKIHKNKYKKYLLDTLMNQYDHSVLRLPPYHPELNPIEKIWASVKNSVAQRNVTFKLDDVKKLAIEKFSNISEAEWACVCKHADKIAQEYIDEAHLLDDAYDSLAFSVNTGESDDESDDESDGVYPIDSE